MSGQGRRSERDVRRRSLGQNFLADRSLISRFVAGLDLATGGLVVDVGAGAGALTVPLAMAGVEVWAVERDDLWIDRLRSAIDRAGVVDSVRARFGKRPALGMTEAAVAAARFGIAPDQVETLKQPAVVQRYIHGREIAVSALREWMAEIGQRATVKVALIGKIKTIAQMFALLCLPGWCTTGTAN